MSQKRPKTPTVLPLQVYETLQNWQLPRVCKSYQDGFYQISCHILTRFIKQNSIFTKSLWPDRVDIFFFKNLSTFIPNSKQRLKEDNVPFCQLKKNDWKELKMTAGNVQGFVFFVYSISVEKDLFLSILFTVFPFETFLSHYDKVRGLNIISILHGNKFR